MTEPVEAVGEGLLRDWRQGDIIELKWTGHFAIDEGQSRPVHINVESMVVVLQSCDVVSPPDKDPWIDLAPLVRLAGDTAALARKRWMPRYVPLLSAGDDAFVDMGQMTRLDKTSVSGLGRRRGCISDEDARTFSSLVGRRFSRPAYEEDVVRSLSGLISRIKAKVGKLTTDEGKRIDLLLDVRVQIKREGESLHVTVFFLLPPDDEDLVFSYEDWDEQVDDWVDKCAPTGRVQTVDGMPIRLSDFSAEQYLNSDGLDVDLLSG